MGVALLAAGVLACLRAPALPGEVDPRAYTEVPRPGKCRCGFATISAISVFELRFIDNSSVVKHAEARGPGRRPLRSPSLKALDRASFLSWSATRAGIPCPAPRPRASRCLRRPITASRPGHPVLCRGTKRAMRPLASVRFVVFGSSPSRYGRRPRSHSNLPPGLAFLYRNAAYRYCPADPFARSRETPRFPMSNRW